MTQCEYPNNTPSTAYGKGCRCGRCHQHAAAQNERFFGERKARVAAERDAQLQRNRIDRPDCQFPQFSPLTSYQRGCRCAPCVEVRRAAARRSQSHAYQRDPAKFIARQKEYLARKKARTEEANNA